MRQEKCPKRVIRRNDIKGLKCHRLPLSAGPGFAKVDPVIKPKSAPFLLCALLGVLTALPAAAKSTRRKAFTGQTSRVASAVVSDISTDDSQSSKVQSSDSNGGSVELAQPVTVPTFMSDVDDSLMSDDLMKHIEGQYSDELQEFSLQNGFYQQERGSRSDSPAILSESEEIQVRQSMAQSMKKYMLLRGVPKFLSTRESTKGLGQAYTKTVAVAQGATRVSFGGKERDSWRFATGVNPFTGKGWMKYGNSSWNFEASDFIDQEDALSVNATKRWQRYTLNSSYLIEQEKVESGVQYQIRKDLSTGLSSRVPVASTNTWDHTVNKVSMRYSF
jgi:hypothetical protein